MPWHEITTLSSQGVVISRPTRPSTSRLVVVCKGGGLTYEFPTEGSAYYANLRSTIDYLAARGYAAVCPALRDTALSAQGDTLGNDASTTKLDAVITAAKALTGISTGKHALIAFSMGVQTQANWARRFGQTALAGMLSLEASVTMADRGTDAAHGSNYAGYQDAYAAEAAAVPTTNNDAFWNSHVYPVHKPVNIAPSITVPWALWNNSDDLLGTPAESAAIAAAGGANITLRNLGTSSGAVLGHNFELLNPKDVHDLLDTWNWG